MTIRRKVSVSTGNLLGGGGVRYQSPAVIYKDLGAFGALADTLTTLAKLLTY